MNLIITLQTLPDVHIAQDHLELPSNWSKNCIVNASESVGIIFSLRRYCALIYWKFKDENIPRKPLVKHLGVTFDKRLTWRPVYQRNFSQRTNAFQYYIIPFFKSKIYNTWEIFSFSIYKQSLRPLLTHAFPKNAHSRTSEKKKKLQIFQNKVIANAPRFIRNENLHKDFQIQEIRDHIKTLANNFHTSINRLTPLQHTRTPAPTSIKNRPSSRPPKLIHNHTYRYNL